MVVHPTDVSFVDPNLEADPIRIVGELGIRGLGFSVPSLVDVGHHHANYLLENLPKFVGRE